MSKQVIYIRNGGEWRNFRNPKNVIWDKGNTRVDMRGDADLEPVDRLDLSEFREVILPNSGEEREIAIGTCKLPPIEQVEGSFASLRCKILSFGYTQEELPISILKQREEELSAFFEKNPDATVLGFWGRPTEPLNRELFLKMKNSGKNPYRETSSSMPPPSEGLEEATEKELPPATREQEAA